MSSSSNENNSPGTLDSNKDFSTKDYTNHNTLNLNDNFMSKGALNNNNDKYLNDEIDIVNKS
jgi:hypothetical protein